MAKLLAQLGGGGDHQSSGRVDGLGTGLHRRPPGDTQAADRLDEVVAGLRDGQSLFCLQGTCRRLGVDGVRLALVPASGAVGADDLDDALSFLAEEAGQAGSVGPGALDGPALDLAVALCPGEHLAVPGGSGRDVGPADGAAAAVLGHGDMGVQVGVDPDADAELLVVRDGAHSHLPFCEAMAITGRRAGQSCDGALASLLSGHCPFGW